MSESVKIEIMDDGPLIVSNLPSLVDSGGERMDAGKKTALCRCGASRNKPLCDGSHRSAGFKSALSPAEGGKSGGGQESLIRVLRNGPYEVCGNTELCVEDEAGTSGDDPYYLCRCGASKNKPFCDGSHRESGFAD